MQIIRISLHLHSDMYWSYLVFCYVLCFTNDREAFKPRRTVKKNEKISDTEIEHDFEANREKMKWLIRYFEANFINAKETHAAIVSGFFSSRPFVFSSMIRNSWRVWWKSFLEKWLWLRFYNIETSFRCSVFGLMIVECTCTISS